MTADLPIEVTFEPPTEIIMASFFAFGLDIRSFREPLKRSVQQVVGPSMQKNFDSGGRPAWEPLSPDTWAQKTGDKALIETGLLQKVAGQLNLWTITSEDASIQDMPRAEYGIYQQFGTKFMPAREWAVIQEEDIAAIDDVFAVWWEERAAMAGFVIGAGLL